jgi:hypothetical protein
MSYFYSNLAKEDTKKKNKQTNEREKCYNAFKKPKKGKKKKPNFKKAVIAGG